MRGFPARYILAFAVMLSGCASKTTDEGAELKIIIAKYNNAVIEAYKYQFFEPLKGVATEDEIRKIDVIVNSYLQANQIMEAELHKINFKDIKIGRGKATVMTSEDWSYRWIDYKTRQEVEPYKDIPYEMVYHLIKKDGKWFVEKVGEGSEMGSGLES